jgi:hypothetical protein
VGYCRQDARLAPKAAMIEPGSIFVSTRMADLDAAFTPKTMSTGNESLPWPATEPRGSLRSRSPTARHGFSRLNPFLNL